ncbi:MAG: LLM class flavin-dependent oxidoreductase [Leptospiraceae bacterium]|nr:LLM class flavin-dependent oxidoreductase [Leptospiraceae bacterium]
MEKDLNSVPYSVLDLAIVREGQSISETFSMSVDLAQKAEDWNYKRIWFAEHHNMEGVASSATSVLIGHIASQTNSIRVGSGGIMLPNHAPLIIAEQFGTLETLYPGRIDLGLGRAPGTDQLTSIALRRNQKAAIEFPETVLELQQYFSATNVMSRVRAIPGEGLTIPIWILGSSTDSAHLAAELGLPYAFASHFAPAQLIQAIAIYRHKFRPSENLEKPYVMPCVSVICADNDKEAEILATSFRKLFSGIITGKREKLKPPIGPEILFLDPAVETAVQQMMAYSFIGGKEKVKKLLQTFLHQTKANEIIITTPIYDHEARLYSYQCISEF